MNDPQKRQLQTLLSDPRWEVVEIFMTEYTKKSFVEQTIKRDTMFNTMWETAFSEGGKMHLQRFFKALEAEAQRAK